MGQFSIDDKPKYKQTILHALKRRGLELLSDEIIIHGPHGWAIEQRPKSRSAVYCPGVFICRVKGRLKNLEDAEFWVAIYPWATYFIQDENHWWQPPAEDRIPVKKGGKPE